MGGTWFCQTESNWRFRKFGKGVVELEQNYDKVLYLAHSRALMT
jgi:hypothetical protein